MVDEAFVCLCVCVCTCVCVCIVPELPCEQVISGCAFMRAYFNKKDVTMRAVTNDEQLLLVKDDEVEDNLLKRW